MVRHGALLHNNNGVWFTYLGRKDGRSVRASCKERVTHATAAEAAAAKKRAEATAQRLRAEWLLGRTTAAAVATVPDAPLFASFAAQWEREWGQLQRGYTGRLDSRVRVLIAQFGALRLTQITPSVVHTWRAQRLEAGAAPRTINRDVDVLKSILSKGAPDYYAQSPLHQMPRLKAAPPITPTLTPQDEETLLAAMDTEDRAIFLVALDSLVRLGDVLSLRWEDVNLTEKTARVNESKHGRTYHVPLSERATKELWILKTILAMRFDGLPWAYDAYYVFPNCGGNARRCVNSYIQRLRRRCQKHGIVYGRVHKGITFHAATRHTGATRLVNAGVDLRTVQELGGWSNIQQLQRYVHPPAEALRAAVEKIRIVG